MSVAEVAAVPAGPGQRTVHRGVRTDPRTKLALLVLFAAATFLAPSWQYELVIMAAAAAFGMISGRWAYPLAMLAVYGLVVAGMTASAGISPGGLSTMLLSFFMLVRKVFPCALVAGVVVSTTRIGEFMAALGRLRIPRSVVIPLAVMLRYLPVIREDWRFITDAMRMRGVSPTPLGLLRSPGRTAECLYVPMLMSASDVADELSIASVARGIENPQRRTCLVPIAFSPADAIVLALGLAVLLGTRLPWGAA